MCVSFGGAANFSGTTLMIHEALVDRRVVHVMGYQNKASVDGRGGRAMILPFPATHALTPEHVLDTEGCPHLLDDMVEAIRPKTRGRSLGVKSLSFSAGVVVFDHGIYTIASAPSAQALLACFDEVMASVPVAKRPSLQRDIVEAYAKWYPGWPIMLWCFNNQEAAKSGPAMVWYEPAFPETLFAPALDCHTGGVPNLRAEVELDHSLIFSSYRLGRGVGEPVDYRDSIPAKLKPYLPQDVLGVPELQIDMSNGDFVIPIKDVLGDSIAIHEWRKAPSGRVIAA